MLIFITGYTNPLEKDFQFTLLQEKYNLLSSRKEKSLEFTTWTQKEVTTPEQNSNDFQFHYKIISDTRELVTELTQKLSDIILPRIHSAEDENDSYGEPIILCAAEYGMTKRMVSAINSKLLGQFPNSGNYVINLYQRFKIPTQENLTNRLRQHLNLPYIDPTDTIGYAYALYRTFSNT